MKFGIVVFPGSNCDYDCFYAVKNILGEKAEHIWHKEDAVGNYDCLILPGGFSYGDYLRTGAIARFSPVMKGILRHAKRGGLIIGICNGFQILLEAGLLPGAMIRNKDIHFICKNVYIKTENNNSPFTNMCVKSQVLNIPIAHNDGCYYIEKDGLSELEEKGLIAFRYCSKSGETDEEHNPNGSVYNIAGILNKRGNILGMMPHPERSVEKMLGCEDGLYIFKSILNDTGMLS
ncbi:MAG: phosphoribosylformylglycinamidine synthase subunit PurQ [Candidatus Omnitrophica bacterium]|jgi:phosphoribosylformylglycinamidine synthase|nr:phosphoribosylformylglycinamidine synthase subunit PurQ [Candidatus Omnitrophota bacterium]